MASRGGALDYEVVARTLRGSGVINNVLKQICAKEGLNKNGVKAELQNRIIERLRLHAQKGDAAAFNRLKLMIDHPGSMNAPSAAAFNSYGTSVSPAPLGSYANVYNNHMGGGPANDLRHGEFGSTVWVVHTLIKQALSFKPSPFYAVLQQVGDLKESMPNHRNTVEILLRASENPVLAKVKDDSTVKIMLFCAAENRGVQDVTFPHQSEIKVNGGEVKANLRGLKNKPGSTRPVDITNYLRIGNVPHYTNRVELTYALTTKTFHVLTYAVKVVPVTDLVKRLEVGKKISRDTVLRDMDNKARDADIVATASILSLKCPLSTLRIDLPCRSISCKHNQCFDATSYLQLQEQAPTWLCPICNQSAPFDSLAVDEYVRDILIKNTKSVDQVTVQPNGAWEVNSKAERSTPNGVASMSSDDDDLVEITKSGDSIRMGAPRSLGTPASGSQLREQSAASTSSAPRNGSTSNKRTAAAVIDLTSSGDEDDEPLPPPKRQHTSAVPPLFSHYSPPGPGNYR